MNELQVFLNSGILFLLILISFLYVIKSVNNKKSFFVIFGLGAVGWIMALLARSPMLFNRLSPMLFNERSLLP
ncbi:MAG: hypothetical protein ACFFCZ_04870 [Promethearchaeota archaeon]